MKWHQFEAENEEEFGITNVIRCWRLCCCVVSERSGLVSLVWGTMSSTTCRFLSDAVNSQKRQLNVATVPFIRFSLLFFQIGTAVLLYSFFYTSCLLLIILGFWLDFGLVLCSQCSESQTYLFITDYYSSSSTGVFSRDLNLSLSIYSIHQIQHVNSQCNYGGN